MNLVRQEGLQVAETNEKSARMIGAETWRLTMATSTPIPMRRLSGG